MAEENQTGDNEPAESPNADAPIPSVSSKASSPTGSAVISAAQRKSTLSKLSITSKNKPKSSRSVRISSSVVMSKSNSVSSKMTQDTMQSEYSGEEGEEEEDEYEEEDINYEDLLDEIGDYMLEDFVEEEEYEAEEEVEEEFISVFDRLDAPRELLSPREITGDMLKMISVQLGQIRLCWPKVVQEVNLDFLHDVILPDGFLMNTNKEKLLLLYCENFRQQYHVRFPNRKPLLLAADNVVRQRKMVCTTLRPTTLTHPNLSTWEELASFVSDHVLYEPMHPATDLPSRMISPQIVFTKKVGNSFEMSTALCSLLLGRNYNSYVVYGFATRDITERIMSRVECPYDEEDSKEKDTSEEEEPSKYALKPPRDLRSKFLMAMEQKEIDKKKKAEMKIKEKQRLTQEELEKPPFDELKCRRIHGWILILPKDEKDETKPFFIETATGVRHELDDPQYCSIQSVWNNVNYWVNLQDDSIGLGNLDYNLKDLDKWEHLLAGEPIQERVHPRNMDMEEEEDDRIIWDEKHLDMPEPWSLKINIAYNELARRFPTGTQTTMFKRTKVERYSPYIHQDGLVMKIHKYTDLECTDLINIEEVYKNRNDRLRKRTEDMVEGLITEYFDRGREDNAKIHYYYKDDNNLESWRKIGFYNKGRFDCLKEIDHGPLYLTESYINRADKFTYRHVIYAKRGEPPPGFLEGPRRIIKSVIEKFEKNELKPSNEDIAVREFDFIGRQMHLKFHYDKGKITASTRTFIKPPVTEMVEGVSFRPELTYGYQAEIGMKPTKNSELYRLLEEQLKAEEDCTVRINHVEDSIAEYLRLRALERMHPLLEVGPFNREQNVHHRQAMLEKERFERTKKEREIEEDLDFIRPYLVRLKCPEKLKLSNAIKVRDLCIKEFKEILVRRANDLQKQFQGKIMWLKQKQAWYNEKLDVLTFEEEQEHFREMNNTNFALHCIEIRLKRHRDMATSRFEGLLQFLELHPQLRILQKLREHQARRQREKEQKEKEQKEREKEETDKQETSSTVAPPTPSRLDSAPSAVTASASATGPVS